MSITLRSEAVVLADLLGEAVEDHLQAALAYRKVNQLGTLHPICTNRPPKGDRSEGFSLFFDKFPLKEYGND